MMYGLYAIRDVKTGFMQPAMDVNRDAAIRNFYHSVSQSEGILFTFASDFSLYHVAMYDSDHGIVDPIIPPVLIAEGSDAVRVMSKEVPKDA